MENRIDRKNDESLYQPKIHSDRIRALYELKEATHKPMTVLLDEAIQDLAERYKVESLLPQETIEEIREKETWEQYVEYRKTLDQLECLKCELELEKLKIHEQGRNTD